MPSSSSSSTSSSARPTKQTYLIGYNLVSFLLWATLLGRILLLLPLAGPSHVHAAVGTWARWTQTLAIFEVLHAAIGVVRAPWQTTALQVLSRFVLVWVIVGQFPDELGDGSPVAYTSMLLAWSVTEVVRYGYFVRLLTDGIDSVPAWLVWLRYNTFYVLYPLGIGSEMWLVWGAVPLAGKRWGDVWAWGLRGALGVYVPGSYVLFTHMMKQRRKVVRGKQKARVE